MNKSIGRYATIAVVGGGLSGSAFVAFLAQFLPKEIACYVSIFIIDRHEYLGRGYPYDTHDDCFILNTDPEQMGIRYQMEFVDWLDSNGIKADNVPRKLYGYYIRQTLKQSIDMLKTNGANVSHYDSLATDIRHVDHQYYISLSDGHQLRAMLLILAVGSCSRIPYSAMHNPMCVTARDIERINLRSLPDEVIVIGTQQSAIDVTMYICTRSDRRVVLASRSGLLPISKGTPLVGYDNCILKNKQDVMTASIDEFKDMLDLEILLAQGDCLIDTRSIASQTLTQSIIEAKSKQLGWQAVMCNITATLQNYYHGLNYENKKRFHEQVFSSIKRLRSAIPLQNAERLTELINCGRVSVWNRVEYIDYSASEGLFCVNLGDRFVKTPLLVNATGQDYYGLEHPLLKQLAFLPRNIFGGICISPHTMQLADKDGKIVNSSCFLIGGGTLGVFLIVNSAQACSNQAQLAAAAVTSMVTMLTSTP